MNALLINPPDRFWLAPPLGLTYIGAYLRDRGIDVTMVDMRVQQLPKGKWDYVCITCTTQTLRESLVVAKKFRNKSKIVFGGSHPSSVKNQMLQKYDFIDYVVFGEGEETIYELISGISPKNIDGLVWRNGKKIVVNKPRKLIEDLDTLPLPARDLLPMRKYEMPGTLLTSRGCPNACAFCTHSICGYTWRGHSERRVIKEIKILMGYGAKEINVIDDNFSYDVNRAKRIMKSIILLSKDSDKKIKFYFYNGLRADRIDRELLQLMKEAGTQLISYGLESADNTVLKKIGKGVTVEQVERALLMTKNTGIQTRVSVMIGNIGDTYQTAMKTIKWVKNNPNIDAAEFCIATAYPETPLYRWVQLRGRMIIKDFENYPTYFMDVDEMLPSFETDDFTAQERKNALRIAQREMFKKFSIKNKSLKNFRISKTPEYARTAMRTALGDDIFFSIFKRGRFKKS